MELDRKKPSHILLFILLLGVICLGFVFTFIQFLNFIYNHFGYNGLFVSILASVWFFGSVYKESDLKEKPLEIEFIKENLEEDLEKTSEEGVSMFKKIPTPSPLLVFIFTLFVLLAYAFTVIYFFNFVNTHFGANWTFLSMLLVICIRGWFHRKLELEEKNLERGIIEENLEEDLKTLPVQK
jgi:Ca2+/Na+ antiporter